MKESLFFYFFLCMLLPSPAQKIYQPDGISYESLFDLPIDSLKQRAEQIQNDTLRARTYGYIGYKYSYLDREQELTYIYKSLELSETIGYQRGIGIAKNNLGSIFSDKGDHNQAMQAYSDALEIAEQSKDSSFVIICLQNIANQLTLREKYGDALQILKRGEQLIKEMLDPHPVAESGLYKHLGGVYRELVEFGLSIAYYNKALNILEEFPNPVDEMFVRINLANSYFDLEQYDQMFIHVERVEEINRSLKSPKIQIIYHNLLGNYYHAVEKDLIQAENHFLKGLDFTVAAEDINFQATFLESLMGLYKEQGNYRKAFERSEVLADIRRIQEENQIANTYEELELKYQTQQRDTEIEILQKERRIQEVELTQQKTRLALIILSFLILAGAMWVYFRGRMKTYRLTTQLAEQAERLSQQELASVQQEMKIKLMQSNLDGQMLERKRLANDLHDSLGGLLASIKLQASAIQEVKEVSPVVEAIDQACREVRSISHSLHPVKFEESTFESLLEVLAGNFSLQGDTQVALAIHDTDLIEKLPVQQKSELYRIVQELLYNSIKHAEAELINVSFTSHEDYLSIVLEDDGKGFHPNETPQGLGLQNIDQRIANLQGEWHLDSTPGHGTIVQLSIPMPSAAATREDVNNL